MTSCTVLRSFSWSSGISTPNLSWAATAISTIARLSMSRSSTKVFSGVTSSAGTPAISSTISPSPARISSWVMAISRTLPRVVTGCVQPASGCWSGYRDHLRGIADARPESDQQCFVARREFPLLDHARQRERDGCGRRVPSVDDVGGHLRLRRPQLASQRFDDPQVGLVGHEDGDLARVDSRISAGLQRHRVQRRGGPPENRLAFLEYERVAVLD